MISKLECIHKIYYMTHDTLVKIFIHSVKKPQSKWKSDGGAVECSSIRGSSSCACVCMPDRHLTHRLSLFSLGWLVFTVSHAGWKLYGTTRVLLHCLPPGHVSVTVCVCAFVWAFEEDKDDMITTLTEQKNLI